MTVFAIPKEFVATIALQPALQQAIIRRAVESQAGEGSLLCF